jgi:hypothetical protein
MLRNIEDAGVLAAYLRSSQIIHESDVLSWMGVSNIEMLGALYDAISDPAVVRCIEPALSDAVVQEFLRLYFGRCLRENPKGEWADSRYSAAWDVAGWLKASWGILSESQRGQWKEWIADHYKSGDAPLREALETGLLEHVFSDKQIARYFGDWGKDRILCDAYRLSLAIAKGQLRNQS